MGGLEARMENLKIKWQICNHFAFFKEAKYSFEKKIASLPNSIGKTGVLSTEEQN